MGLIQAKAFSSTTASGSPTSCVMDSPVVAGHGLLVMAGALSSSGFGTITAVTLGGSADNFASLFSPAGQTHASAAAWGDPNCAGGTTIAVTLTGGSPPFGNFIYIYEFDDLPSTLAAWLDKSSAVDSTGGFITTFSSGATATTAQASEHVVGFALGHANGTTGASFTGPASPWTNLAGLTEPSNTLTDVAVSGWQSVSSAGAFTYSGTAAVASTSDAIVVTLKRVSGTAHTATAALTVTPAGAAARQRGKLRTGTLAVSPSLAAGRQRGKHRTGTLPVQPSFGASRARGRIRGATLPVVPSFATARVQGHARGATLHVGLAFSTARVVAHHRTAGLLVVPAFLAELMPPPPPAVTGVSGGWWQLLDIREYARQEFDWWADQPPMACPHCGEPLRNSPPADSGSSAELFCQFDGWQYPRDYVRPQRL